MTSCEALFVGGPADGHLIAVRPGPDGNPPDRHGLPEVSGHTWSESDELPKVGLYQREVNPADDGPLWLYRYLGNEEG